MDIESLSGNRKAAILMVVLGDEIAGKLLKQLPRESVTAIAAEIAGIGTIDPETAQAVLDDYFTNAMGPEEHRGGPDVATRLLDRAGIPESDREPLFGTAPDPTCELLEPLLEAPPATLAAVLGKEHAQTAALVLLNLDPEIAASVLVKMPDEVRSETVVRMTTVRKVRGEILSEVAESLRARLEDSEIAVDEDEEEDGVGRTAAVLQAMNRNDVRGVLEAVEREDAARAAQLREFVYTFETLLLADDRGIQELLRLVDGKTIALALHETDEALSRKFLSNLSERAAGMLKEEMEFLGSVRPADQQVAQHEIIENALRLEQDEKLFFGEPDEE